MAALSDDECRHALDPRWCASCKEPLPRTDTVEVEAVFKARFDGQCPGCNLPIVVGQTILRLSDERYVHRGCV